MSEKLEDIKNCHVCGGNRLLLRIGLFIPDIFTDEEIKRDAIQCQDCDTLHYIDGGVISYEFSCEVNKEIGKKKYVNEKDI